MRTQKFSPVGRCHLKESITRMRGDMSGASYSLKYLRPIVRGLLLAIAAGERIPPEKSCHFLPTSSHPSPSVIVFKKIKKNPI